MTQILLLYYKDKIKGYGKRGFIDMGKFFVNLAHIWISFIGQLVHQVGGEGME